MIRNYFLLLNSVTGWQVKSTVDDQKTTHNKSGILKKINDIASHQKESLFD